MVRISPPKFEVDAFHCPNCDVYAHQFWYNCFATSNGRQNRRLDDLRISVCGRCGEAAYWLFEGLIFPPSNTAPPPNGDLSPEIIEIYHEASAIADNSPRGAAALLRLCVQLLCKQLGEKGTNVNEDIGKLASKGLPIEIRQALDVVRVIGNNAVHPGEISVNDDPDTVSALFWLVNSIAEKMITEPKKVAELHDKLPESVRAAIAARDNK